MSAKETLFVLVTKPFDLLPKSLAKSTLSMADKVTLAEEGVYNTPAKLSAAGVAVDLSKWSVLWEDAEARRVESVFSHSTYSDMAGDIEKYQKTIVL